MSRAALKAGGIDIRSIIQSVFHLWKDKFNSKCLGPVDGTVLRMHYRWTFYFLVGGFMTVWYGWYYGPIIHCINTFQGDKPARDDYENICLSYPFVEEEYGKRYILFYRWVHWTFLLLAFIYYSPRKLSKSLENPKAKKILEDLTTLHPRYDQAEKEAVQRASFFVISNFRTQDGLYWKQISIHIFALSIDIFVLRFLDFILHGRFLYFVPNSYPFSRNVTDFSDYISKTFPPFAECILSDQHKILHGRTETIGCHLTAMELYEKLFFIFWLIIYSLIVVTTIYIIFLLFMKLPAFHKYYLGLSKPITCTSRVNQLLLDVSRKSRVGDIYILYRIKPLMSHLRYYELLTRIADDKLIANRTQAPSVVSPVKSVQNGVPYTNFSVPEFSNNINSNEFQNLTSKQEYEKRGKKQIQLPNNNYQGNNGTSINTNTTHPTVRRNKETSILIS